MNILVIFSFYYLLVIISVSGFSKLIQVVSRNKKTRVPDSLISAITDSIYFAIFEIVASVIFILASHNSLIQIMLASLFLLMMAGGIYVRTSELHGNCNCFGALTPKNNVTFFTISIVGIISASIILFANFGLTGSLSHLNSFTSVILASFSIITVLLFIWKSIKSRYAEVQNAVAETNKEQIGRISHLTGDCFLGHSNGDNVLVKDLAREDKLLFIVGVSYYCKSCKDLLPDLMSFIKGFGEQFPIVIISDKADYINPDKELKFHYIVDSEASFSEALNLSSNPFAVLLNGTTLELLAPPTSGDNSIRMLFAAGLNARA